MVHWFWNRSTRYWVGVLIVCIPIFFLPSVVSVRAQGVVTTDSIAGEPGIPFVVNSTGDAPDVDLTDGICAIDRGTDLCTLRAAVQQANATVGPNLITFELATPATISLADELVISDALTISGPGIDRLLIDGNQAVRHFVIDLPATAAAVVALTDLTLANGQSPIGKVGDAGHGGSIYYPENDRIINLASNASAGDVAAARQRLEMARVRFRNNASPAGEGGALYIGGRGATTHANVIAANLHDVTFIDNYAEINGGAIANFGLLTIEESLFTANRTADNGGALFSRSADDLTLTNTIFTDNEATTDGGALNNQGGNLFIIGGEFNQNRAGDDGGAIYNLPLDDIGTTLTISGSTVMDNHANDQGGAIYNGSVTVTSESVLTTVITIAATDLISNSAGSAGGALYSTEEPNSGLGAIRHHHVAITQGSQLIRNRAGDSGGALYVQVGTLTVSDTLLQENRVTNREKGRFAGGAIAVVNSLVQLTNSDFVSNFADSGSGGALAILQSRVDIVSSHFRANSAAASGGAVDCLADALNYSITNLTINDALFQGNFGQNGGAVALDNCTWSMDNSRLEENHVDIAGGAIFSMDSIGTLRNSSLSRNQAPTGSGGAIYMMEAPSFALRATKERGSKIVSLEIISSSLTANLAGVHGGAIDNQLARLSITDSTLSENNVTGAADGGLDDDLNVEPGGGAIYNNGTIEINQSTIRDNQSVWVGGALLNTRLAYITNSTFSGNVATTQGGAIANLGAFTDSRATLIIDQSTVTANRAAQGGGVVNRQTVNGIPSLTIGSSILAGNRGDRMANECFNAAAAIDETAPFQSLGYNITTVQERTTCRFDGPNDQILPADQIFSTVMEQQLADNGGATTTHALLTGSPAIDQLPGDVNSCETTVDQDQRGVARPIGTNCDIGAYEAIAPQIFITKTVGTDPDSCAPTAALTVNGGATLYYCLTVKNGDHIAINHLQIDDPALEIGNLPLTVTLAPGDVHQFTHQELPPFGSVRARDSSTNTLTVMAETVSLPVTGEVLSVRAVASATVVVLPTYTITLSRSIAVQPVGQQQLITATVVDHNGDTVVGETVEFVVQGTNSYTGSLPTAADGKIHFPYMGTVNRSGSDTITAMIPAAQARATDLAAHSLAATAAITTAWRAITITVFGVGDGTATVAERTISAQVTTTDTGEAVDGLQVGFMVTGTNTVAPLFAETRQGQVSFNYVSLPPATGNSNPALANYQTPSIILAAYHPSQQRQVVTDDGLDHISLWVDLNRNRQFDTGEPQKYFRIRSVITLVSFDAQRNPDGSVRVTWRTAVELDNTGFNLYRAANIDGPYTKLNEQLIAAQGMGMAMGATYQYMDRPPTDAPVYYLLEDIDFYGARTQHGPIRWDDVFK